MRILIRPRLPVLGLLLLAPAIPELLTGSTPIAELVLNPIGFLVGFAFEVGLYGGGAILIREFAVAYRKGWSSILLLGAAYGIAEEGFAVHTFFQTSGQPVGALATFGHAYGVNWVWAFGITAFHATYSIALPILLIGLWFPEVRAVRWLDSGAAILAGAVYLATVVFFGVSVRYAPGPFALVFFLGVVALLGILAWFAPRDLLAVGPGTGTARPLGLVLAGTLGFDAWLVLLVLSATGRIPAVGVAVAVVGINLAALAYLTRRVGDLSLDRSKFYFATGMLLILFVWDVPVELSRPGILGVAALFAYLQYRLGRRIASRSPAAGPAIPVGATAPDPPPLG